MAFISVRDAGESQLFPPQFLSEDKARDAILVLLHSDPHAFGIQMTRWSLASILSVCDWLRLRSLSGLCRLLRRIGISLKRAREHIHSPDPAYVEKLAYVDLLVEKARASSGKLVVLFEDELTYYRQPTLARAYEHSGKSQPLAELDYHSDTKTRVAGVLNVSTGQVTYYQGKKTGIAELMNLYIRICKQYPNAERIYIILDNWPIHFHPDILIALETQEFIWPIYRPSHWSDKPSKKATSQYAHLNLPIRLVPLPTYAPWSNRIEKLWRKGKQEVIHIHRYSAMLAELRSKFAAFLDQFATGSDTLLRYVGLEYT